MSEKSTEGEQCVGVHWSVFMHLVHVISLFIKLISPQALFSDFFFNTQNTTRFLNIRKFSSNKLFIEETLLTSFKYKCVLFQEQENRK